MVAGSGYAGDSADARAPASDPMSAVFSAPSRVSPRASGHRAGPRRPATAAIGRPTALAPGPELGLRRPRSSASPSRRVAQQLGQNAHRADLRGRPKNQRSGKDAQMDRSCARTRSVQEGVTVGRSRRLVQRLELRDQRPNVLTHLYLSEEDAGRAVRVDEEVCTQSAGPADPAALGSLCLHGHAKNPSHAVAKPREEAVRGLEAAGTWSLVICRR